MAPRPQLRVLPLHPLEHAAGATSISTAATTFGVNTRRICRWRRNGLSLNEADMLCEHVGLHPLDVWPDQYRLEATVELIVVTVVERELTRTRRWVHQWLREHQAAA